MNFDEIYTVESCDGATYKWDADWFDDTFLYWNMRPTKDVSTLYFTSASIEQRTILLISGLILIVKYVYAHKISLIYLQSLLKLRRVKNFSSVWAPWPFFTIQIFSRSYWGFMMKNFREISQSTSKSHICLIFRQQIKLERKENSFWINLKGLSKENTEVNNRNCASSEGQWFPPNLFQTMPQNTSHSNSFKEEKPCLLPIHSNGSDAKKVNFNSNQGWTSKIFLNVLTSYQTYKQINLIVTGCVSLCDHCTRQIDFSLSTSEVQKGSLNILVEEKFKTSFSSIIEPNSTISIQI